MYTTLTPVSQDSSFQSTILVVEDDEDNLIYISTALSLFNYHCLIARDALTGLSLAQQWQPDLILLDVRMPQINGLELLKILRIDWLTRKIPVIAVTALAGAKEQEMITSAGFDGCLIKPYLLEQLEDIVCFHISKKSSC
ncbi:MAG: response regulator [Pleurocapsa sp. SU_5_0]|nr:response regulator [Pleurocapsa sp. SU_5_0]NJO94750.1 response regulator [Pleurocapsa sp. CRU_1_2]NJR46698.1 response regulator [Hyellaceae cyanobacterium CSU_1_1]